MRLLKQETSQAPLVRESEARAVARQESEELSLLIETDEDEEDGRGGGSREQSAGLATKAESQNADALELEDAKRADQADNGTIDWSRYKAQEFAILK